MSLTDILRLVMCL